MIRNWIYLVVVLAIFSCQSIDKNEKPKILIGEDKMVEVLTDIAFVKAAKTAQKKLLEEKNINPEAYILQKHSIDSIVFEENNVWYSSRLEEYEKIFTRVKTNLEQSKNKYEKLKKEEDSIKKREDSIHKIKDILTDKEKLLEGHKDVHE